MTSTTPTPQARNCDDLEENLGGFNRFVLMLCTRGRLPPEEVSQIKALPDTRQADAYVQSLTGIIGQKKLMVLLMLFEQFVKRRDTIEAEAAAKLASEAPKVVH